MTFFTGAVFTTLARNLRQKIRPMFMIDDKTPKGTKPIYDFFSWVFTFLSLQYVVSSFVLLDWHDSIELYTSLYFIVVVVAAVMWIGLSFVRAPRKKTTEAEKPKTT